MAPAWLDCGLGLCWLGVTRAAKLVALAGLWLASVPSLWAAPFLTALTGGAVPLLEASAALSGYPVPVMAAQAIWLGNGWRSVAGASALIAWGVGWHSPCGRGSCQALGLVAVAAGSSSASWGAYLACEAALRFPAFPGPELPSASSSGDGLGPQGVAVAAGLAPNALPAANAASVPPPPAPSPDTRRARTSRVNGATWFVDVKPTAMASSCCAATCKKTITKGSLRVRSSAAHAAKHGWFHVECVDGGLGPIELVEGVGALSLALRTEVARWCDTPGGASCRLLGS